MSLASILAVLDLPDLIYWTFAGTGTPIVTGCVDVCSCCREDKSVAGASDPRLADERGEKVVVVVVDPLVVVANSLVVEAMDVLGGTTYTHSIFLTKATTEGLRESTQLRGPIASIV